MYAYVHTYILCEYYEHLLMQKLKAFEFQNHSYDCTSTLRAIRYVDDLQVFIVANKQDSSSIKLAKSIIDRIHYDTYHPDMKLKK